MFFEKSLQYNSKQDKSQICREILLYPCFLNLYILFIANKLQISNLKLPVIELVAIFKKKLIGGSKTCLYAVFDNSTRSWWTRQFLNLKDKYDCTMKRMNEQTHLNVRILYSIFGRFKIFDLLSYEKMLCQSKGRRQT